MLAKSFVVRLHATRNSIYATILILLTMLAKLLFFSLFLGLAHSGELLGQKSKVEKYDEVVRELAETAAVELDKYIPDFYRWDLYSIDDVQKHIVSGVQYTLQVKMLRTECLKGSKKPKSQCPQKYRTRKCTVKIERRSWKHYENVTVIGCEEPVLSRAYRHVKKAEGATPKAFLMEEFGRIVKPKDYISWKRFTDFADKYEKTYESKKHIHHRFNVFKRNLKHIKKWQSEEQGTAVYGVTQYSDMTPHEWKKTYLPYVWEEPVYMNNVADLQAEGINLNDELPESFDWREKGAVTGVKNQEACGSCWAFSTTGNVEGQWFLAKNKLVSLAEQQLVDCDSLDQGCNGGLPSNAYKEIIRMGGLEPEDKYPYDGRGETCHITRKEIAVYINGSVELPHDEESMKAWLVKKGPISIGINANPLQFYRHGISYPFKIFCEPFMLNHGVLIVGYGTEKKKPYWTIKNSWGSSWGESGYYRLYRGKNVCGVREMATSATVN